MFIGPISARYKSALCAAVTAQGPLITRAEKTLATDLDIDVFKEVKPVKFITDKKDWADFILKQLKKK